MEYLITGSEVIQLVEPVYFYQKPHQEVEPISPVIEPTQDVRPNRLYGRFRKIIACGATALALSGCLPLASEIRTALDGTTAEADKKLVAVAGDSQACQAEFDNGAALCDPRVGDQPLNIHKLSDKLTGDDFRVTTALWTGAKTCDVFPGVCPTAFRNWTEQPDVLVWVLGVNDANKDSTTGLQPSIALNTSENYLNTYLSQLQPKCSVLVGVPETKAWKLDIYGKPWNDFLRQKQSDNPNNIVFIDWAEVLRQHPDYVNTTDEVHQTAPGREAFRVVIEEGAKDCRNKIFISTPTSTSSTTTTTTILETTTTTSSTTSTSTSTVPDSTTSTT